MKERKLNEQTDGWMVGWTDGRTVKRQTDEGTEK